MPLETSDDEILALHNAVLSTNFGCTGRLHYFSAVHKVRAHALYMDVVVHWYPIRYISILLILTSSCTTKKPISEQIIGFWYYCQPNGTYHEVHIFEDRFSTHFGTLPFNPYEELEYSLTSDTVSFELKNWNPGTVKTKIKVIDKDQISWQIVNADKTFSPQLLTRIPFEVQLRPESDSVSLYDWSNEQFQRRIERIACPDLRTPEQVIQDSIDFAEMDAYLDSLDFL